MNPHKARQSWHSSAECYSPVGENLLFFLYEHYIQSVYVDKMEYQMMHTVASKKQLDNELH